MSEEMMTLTIDEFDKLYIQPAIELWLTTCFQRAEELEQQCQTK